MLDAFNQGSGLVNKSRAKNRTPTLWKSGLRFEIAYCNFNVWVSLRETNSLDFVELSKRIQLSLRSLQTAVDTAENETSESRQNFEAQV